MFYRDQILKDLREYVLEVQFKKVDGTDRTMRCTLRPDLLPPSYATEIYEEKKFHKENEQVIAVWDITKAGWRSFRVDNIEYVQNINDNY
jgi:hypothetical protein